MQKGDLAEENKTAFVLQNQHKNGSSNIHTVNHVKSCRKRHCAFGMPNILLSGKLAKGFELNGDVATMGELTIEEKNDMLFWTGVQEAFINSHPVHDKLQFTDDQHLNGNIGVNPSKLKSMIGGKSGTFAKMSRKDGKQHSVITRSLEHTNQISLDSVKAPRTSTAVHSFCFSRELNQMNPRLPCDRINQTTTTETTDPIKMIDPWFETKS